jgi:hypothetical protein
MPRGKGKRVYFEKSDAKAAKRIINKSPDLDPITNIYWCDDCSGYHLTTMNKDRSRKLTRKLNKQRRA